MKILWTVNATPTNNKGIPLSKGVVAGSISEAENKFKTLYSDYTVNSIMRAGQIDIE